MKESAAGPFRRPLHHPPLRWWWVCPAWLCGCAVLRHPQNHSSLLKDRTIEWPSHPTKLRLAILFCIFISHLLLLYWVIGTFGIVLAWGRRGGRGGRRWGRHCHLKARRWHILNCSRFSMCVVQVLRIQMVFSKLFWSLRLSFFRLICGDFERHGIMWRKDGQNQSNAFQTFSDPLPLSPLAVLELAVHLAKMRGGADQGEDKGVWFEFSETR